MNDIKKNILSNIFSYLAIGIFTIILFVVHDVKVSIDVIKSELVNYKDIQNSNSGRLNTQTDFNLTISSRIERLETKQYTILKNLDL
tara:strand:+ start:31025 stop:31285 length:261 start_codon:yes stop_codon:yes gene_type:complete